MANVLFKRGLQADLYKLMQGGATDGCFYLTTDSHRLYVGQGSKAVPVNEGVTSVASLSELTNIANALSPDEKALMAGSFYYITEDNILCVYNGNQFVQINPDTNTETRITDVATNVDATKEKIVVTTTLTQKTCDPVTGAPLPTNKVGVLDPVVATFEITADQFNALVQEVNVGLELTVSGTEAKIATTGFGAEKDSITFKAGEAINFTYDDTEKDVVTISSKDTKHSIGVAKENDKAVVKLTSDNNMHPASSAEFKAGKDLTVDVANDAIVYTHASYDDKSADVTRADAALGHEGKFNVISKIESSNGHVTNIETQELTLPKDNYITKGELQDNGDLVFDYAITTTPSIRINTDGTYHSGEGTWHVGGVLDVYTTSEIDDKIAEVKAQANALTYRGVVSSDLPFGEDLVSIGDVWMAGSNDIAQGNKVGDLFIAVGKNGATEEEDGFLAASNIAWDLVPSGNDLDSQYDLLFAETLDGAVIQLKNTTTTTAPVDSVEIHDDGNVIQISVEADKDDAEHKFIKVAHKAYAAPTVDDSAELEPLGAEETFTIVKDIVTESGHVTEIVTQEYQLPKDTKYTIGAIADENNENAATIKLSSPNNSTVNPGSVQVASDDTLDVSVADNVINIKHADMGAKEDGTLAEETVKMTSEESFTVITGVNLDNGHLVDYTKTTFQLPPSDKYEYEGSIVKDSTLNKVGIETVLYDGQHLGQRFGYDVVSDSLQLSVTAATVGADGVVTTPASMAIEMVWGTF